MEVLTVSLSGGAETDAHAAWSRWAANHRWKGNGVDDQELLDAYRQLTDRQQRVLAHLCRGHPRVEIAMALGIKPRLVDADIAVIYRAFDLDDSGLTPAQRRFELRHYLQRVRKGEQQKPAAVTTAPTEPSPSLSMEKPKEAEPRTPTTALVHVPAPIPAPLASAPSWRWWWFAAAVVVLLVAVSLWRVTHPPRPTTVAGATITPSTRPTVPAVVLAPTVMSSTAAPSPTMTPVPPSPTTPPTPALAATTTVNPAASPVDLAGKVESTLPGTSLQLGSVITTVIDDHSKPRDVYALSVQAGHGLRVTVTATSWSYSVALGALGALPTSPSEVLCTSMQTCTKTIPIAATGTYLLVVQAFGPGVRYTLHTAALPLVVGQDTANLAGTVANDVPGTSLAPGTTITSVIDVAAKRRDVYAVSLAAGQTLQVDTDANRWDYRVLLLPPGTTSVQQVSAVQGTLLCSTASACHKTAPIATSGAYLLVVEASGPGVQYTLRVTTPGTGFGEVTAREKERRTRQ